LIFLEADECDCSDYDRHYDGDDKIWLDRGAGGLDHDVKAHHFVIFIFENMGVPDIAWAGCRVEGEA
jgi:hypothetical protein